LGTTATPGAAPGLLGLLLTMAPDRVAGGTSRDPPSEPAPACIDININVGHDHDG